jgi:DNA-binding MarR family transcriptional regulator
MQEPHWLDDTEAKAWRGHLRMSWLLDAAIARDLARETGLSYPDYHVLAWLSEAPGRRMRMTDLAAGMRWSKSRLSHQIARMEARGLVSRAGCPSDARGTFAILTPKGFAAIEQAAPGHVASIRRHLLDVLTREQVESLAGITETVVDRLADGSAQCDSSPGGLSAYRGE